MASHGQEMRTMEGYVTAFDTDAYMKDYYPRDYFVNFTENQTDLSGTSEVLDYMPLCLQFWLDTFSKGKILNQLHNATCTHTCIQTYKYSSHSSHMGLQAYKQYNITHICKCKCTQRCIYLYIRSCMQANTYIH